MNKTKSPTVKELAIMAFIQEYTDKNLFPPSVREIGEAVGLSSSNTTWGYLDRMQFKGMIVKTSRARSIKVIWEG